MEPLEPPAAGPRMIVSSTHMLPFFRPSSYHETDATAWKMHRGPAVASLAYCCGLAPVEIAKLRWRDWRPEGQDVVIAAASANDQATTPLPARRERMVPLMPVVVRAVEEYLERIGFEPAPYEPLIWASGGADEMKAVVKRASKKVRMVPPVTLAQMRASFEVLLQSHDDLDGLVEYLIGARRLAFDVPGPPTINPPVERLRRLLRKAHPLWTDDRAHLAALRE